MSNRESSNVPQWDESVPYNQTGAIEAPMSIDCEKLTAIFDACIVENQVASTKSGIRQHQHYWMIQ